MLRILFASSEAYPLIKTGGLADVSGSLPRALLKLGHDVRILMPAYRDALQNARAAGVKTVATFTLENAVSGDHTVSIMETRLPGSRVKTWLLDCPALFDRPGNPYLDENNQDYADNDLRFLLFSRAAAELGLNRCGLDWQPDVVHCNDWQTGLTPVFLDQLGLQSAAAEQPRPATVFTIHNLAYQGLYGYETFTATQLPANFWHHEALEFHNQFSLIKGGIVYADRVNTVSPTYAREIQSERFGYGLQGLLRHRGEKLSGILNGINDEEWNPGTDAYLMHRYNRRTIAQRTKNKLELQKQLGLKVDASIPLLGFIGRLVEQKGVDWILANINLMLERGAQLVVLGNGEHAFEAALREAAALAPLSIAATIGYNEALAHRIEAASDIFLMPSKFEPCGLNQLYSLRYGAVPLVHNVGGLADTVIDTTASSLEDGSATGFVFDSLARDEPGDIALQTTLGRALDLYTDKPCWQSLQSNGMQQDNSWKQSALKYERLYRAAIADVAGKSPAYLT
ncbi:MAG: gt5A [Verrucomicrobiaceae bacterium]|nr:gt5A [Verrucomicrobiaceae bacterium]